VILFEHSALSWQGFIDTPQRPGAVRSDGGVSDLIEQFEPKASYLQINLKVNYRLDQQRSGDLANSRDTD
jgi:hypothetical protein